MTNARERLAWLVLAAIGAWLLWPALFPGHVEGFSASMVALGHHVAAGSVGDFMPFAPFNADYFGLTKLGVVLWVALLAPLMEGEAALRLAMWGGMLLTLGASAVLIRGWTGARWIVCAAALLVMPGVVESGFFFNDNVPATGLLLLALAMIARLDALPSALAAGLLIGCAVTVRTDVLVVAATAVPLIASEGRALRRATVTTLTAAAAALAVWFALYAIVSTTPLDAIRAGGKAVAMWNRPLDLGWHLSMLLYFAGLGGLALALLGLLRLVRVKAWRRLLLFAGVPLAFNLVFAGKMWEVRQFLVLAPFLGALVAQGVEGLLDDLAARQRMLPVAMALLVAVTLVGPRTGLNLSDGPRLLTGRLGGVLLWRNWQESVRQDFGRIDGLIAAAPGGRTLAVLTDGWDEDRYLHLRLVQQGFRPVALPPACAMLGQAMRRGDRTVLQLTVRQSFALHWERLHAERYATGVLPCLAAMDSRDVLLLIKERRLETLLGRNARGTQLDPVLRALGMGEIVAVPLDAGGLRALDEAYRRNSDEGRAGPGLAQSQADVASATPFSR